MKNILFYIEFYIFNLPLYLYHELSHFILVILTWCLFLTSFPKLVVKRWAYCGNCEDDGQRRQYSFMMYVEYNNRLGINWLDKIVAIMPVISTIVLFWISPWYLYPYYLSHINTLWLSQTDIDKIIDKNHTI